MTAPWEVGEQVSPILPHPPEDVGGSHLADQPPSPAKLPVSRVLGQLKVCFAVSSSVLCVYLTVSSLFPTFSVLPVSLFLYFIQQRIAEKSRALLPTAQRVGKQQVGAEYLPGQWVLEDSIESSATGAPGKGGEDQGPTVWHREL